jgi:RNA polymerase sigma-70 factor (ECF subfamily)
MNTSMSIENIWNEFHSGLRSFIFSKVNNEHDASDILQEAFIKIHNNIDKLKDKTRIKPWIYQITRNLIIDYYRARNFKKNISGLMPDVFLPSSSDRFMDTAINDMIKMMDDLSPEYCEALCLTEIEGLSQKEYAQMKGISYSGAKSRVQRARIMLKDMLMKCCHYQFDKYGTVFDIQPGCCCCHIQ